MVLNRLDTGRALIWLLIILFPLCSAAVGVDRDGVCLPPDSSRTVGVVGFKPGLSLLAVRGKIIASSEAKRAVHDDISKLSELGLNLTSLFSTEDAGSKANRASSPVAFKEGGPDLERWFLFEVPNGLTMQETLVQLRSLSVVDSAYPLPHAVPASLGAEEVPNFMPLQDYLGPAPEGLDVRYAWNQPGGRGERVVIADVEGSWNVNHHDLKRAKEKRIDGHMLGGIWLEHGTAVVGQLVGSRNGYGITGISHKSKIRMFSIGRMNDKGKVITNVPDAVYQAATALNAGDVMVIEVQYSGVNQTGYYVPVEYYDADFEAILFATRKGIVVVEAAGNGGQDLDRDLYEDRFKRKKRDSLAILVGAGAPPSGFGPDRSRLSFSNFGSRVDVQGWGKSVTTTGYGDLYWKGGRNFFYTDTFNGTSSATGMLGGVVAVLQSIAIDHTGKPLKPKRLRKILTRTGSPQQGNTKQNIGPRPNLKKAVKKIMKLPKPVTGKERPVIFHKGFSITLHHCPQGTTFVYHPDLI